MIRSSIGYFSTPHIAVQSRQSSTIRTTSLAILALAPSEKGKGCRKATCSCRLWASPPFSATLAALTQHSNHTQHGIQQTSTPPCQPTGFRVASQRPQHSAAACPLLIPSAAHKVRRRVATDLCAVGFPSGGCRQNWACLGSQEEPKPSIK
jgi:hypothetical protein